MIERGEGSRGEVFLGVDIGTSAVKAILVAPGGEVCATGSSPLSMRTPRPGWAEQEPDDWWGAAVAAIRAVLRASPGPVAAVGLSGQMHSSVFLNATGAVVRPALLWCDARTGAECREITARAGGEEGLRARVLNPAVEGFTLPKVLWLRKHEPAAYGRVATLLLAKDFVRYRLTGELATEPSDASGTLLFDPVRRCWSEEMLEIMEVPSSWMPAVGGSAEVLGRVGRDAAGATGLAPGTPVVGGGSDNACGAAGAGVVRPGQVVAGWGTSGIVLAPVIEPRVDPGLRVHTFCHVAPDTWYNIGVVLSAGGAFAWYRDRLLAGGVGPGTAGNAAAATLALNEEAAGAPRGSGGVVFLPYLQGERTPHRSGALRGALVGLSLAHERRHVSRAVLEGVCFAMRDSLEILRELGLRADQVVLTGGGARSAFIRRLQAEIFGSPVVTVDREEGPAYAAALLAAVGAGAFQDLFEAVSTTLPPGTVERPDPGAVAAYGAPYARFRAASAAATIPAQPST